MTPRPVRAEPDADAEARLLNEDDPLWKDPIDDNSVDDAQDRLFREFVRQLQQQENTHMTMNREQRLANVRALESLQRQLERMARNYHAREQRRSAKESMKPDEDFDALERRLLPLLERAMADKDKKGVVSP